MELYIVTSHWKRPEVDRDLLALDRQTWLDGQARLRDPARGARRQTDCLETLTYQNKLLGLEALG